VALFAEQFKEMLETRCGRGLLRCLYILEKQVHIAWQTQCATRCIMLGSFIGFAFTCATVCCCSSTAALNIHMRLTTGQRGKGEKGGGAKGAKGG
jgi:hypothetical protein